MSSAILMIFFYFSRVDRVKTRHHAKCNTWDDSFTSIEWTESRHDTMSSAILRIISLFQSSGPI